MPQKVSRTDHEMASQLNAFTKYLSIFLISYFKGLVASNFDLIGSDWACPSIFKPLRTGHDVTLITCMLYCDVTERCNTLIYRAYGDDGEYGNCQAYAELPTYLSLKIESDSMSSLYLVSNVT